MMTLQRVSTEGATGSTPRFLYAIIRQLDTRQVDWDEVGRVIQAGTNGHAQRMRFARFRDHMEGGRAPPSPIAGHSTRRAPRREAKLAARKKAKQEQHSASPSPEIEQEDDDAADQEATSAAQTLIAAQHEDARVAQFGQDAEIAEDDDDEEATLKAEDDSDDFDFDFDNFDEEFARASEAFQELSGDLATDDLLQIGEEETGEN